MDNARKSGGRGRGRGKLIIDGGEGFKRQRVGSFDFHSSK
jgi:hypothetical protein